VTLLVLADQKRIQGTRPWIRKECAFPTILLVDYEIELIEVVSGYKCFIAGFFRKDTVKFSISLFKTGRIDWERVLTGARSDPSCGPS